MPALRSKKFLIPFLAAFLLLSASGVLVGRMGGQAFLYQDAGNVRIPPFRTKDLHGNIVTQDIFTGKFTVACLWVTQDPDNSRELLASINDWRNSAQAPFQLVGVVGDLRDTADGARADAARSVAEKIPSVPQILVSDGLASLLARIRNAPTVFFVDGQGNLVGQPVVGNEPLLVRKETMRLIKAESGTGKLQERLQEILFCRP